MDTLSGGIDFCSSELANRLHHNVVTGNRPTGPSFLSGGIAVAGGARQGGNDPVGNLVQADRLRDNQPDLFYDGSGSDNMFVQNSCETSIPDGLC